MSEKIISRHFRKDRALDAATQRRRATWGHMNMSQTPNTGVWQCLEYRVQKCKWRLRRWAVIER